MVVVLPVDRVLRGVEQGVVHPAHVPLEPEPEPALRGGPGDAGPGGGLLGDHQHARVVPVDGGVDLLEERDGLQVLPAAVHVRRPLPVGAGVVQVEHRGHRVHAQPVDVELVQPVQRVGDEEVAHLVAAEVEDVRAPVGVLAATRVGVLVQRGAVETGEGPLVLREVRRHPVQEHPDAGGVQPVHQVAEVVRVAEPGRRRVVAGDLVAPRAAERVLHHRQELHVGEAHLQHVRGELLGQLPIAEAGPPGAQVHLVHAHRLLVRRLPGPAREPVRVAPLVP